MQPGIRDPGRAVPTVNSVQRKATSLDNRGGPLATPAPNHWALPCPARVPGHVVIFCGTLGQVYLIQHPFFDLVLGFSS